MLYKTLLMAAVFFGFSLPRMAQNEPWIVHMPTPQPMVNKMLELAEVQRDHLVYDLGSGDGRIVMTVAKKVRRAGFAPTSTPAYPGSEEKRSCGRRHRPRAVPPSRSVRDGF